MARQVIYQCPGTAAHPAHKFGYFHYPDIDRDPLPRFCGVCGYDSEAEEFPAMPSAPHIAKSIGKAGDTTYRQMEWQAEQRIQAAAEMTGAPASDFNDMKITNMKDNQREGDIAAIAPPPSEVSKLMDNQPQAFGFQNLAGPIASSVGYAAGQTPVAAEKAVAPVMQETLGNFHRQNYRGMNARAQTGHYTGT